MVLLYNTLKTQIRHSFFSQNGLLIWLFSLGEGYFYSFT
ncbi:hypothetical protein FM106_12785 [Brachybacterium faecium]|nr:hypothetical protein FM106_12785 [Brachybacterium faecium]